MDVDLADIIRQALAMGFSGGDLWEFVDSFGIHIPAVFMDLISDEMMEVLRVFAKLRAWCLRIVSKVAPTKEEIETFVGDTADRAVRGVAEKCGRLQNVIGEMFAEEVKAGMLKLTGVPLVEGGRRLEQDFEPLAPVQEEPMAPTQEEVAEAAAEEEEEEDEEEDPKGDVVEEECYGYGGNEETTSPVQVFLMGPAGGVCGVQTAGEAAAAAAAAAAATIAAIIADAVAAADSLRRARRTCNAFRSLMHTWQVKMCSSPLRLVIQIPDAASIMLWSLIATETEAALKRQAEGAEHAAAAAATAAAATNAAAGAADAIAAGALFMDTGGVHHQAPTPH